VVAGEGTFDVYQAGHCVGTVIWPLSGLHNVANALAAIAAAHHAGIAPLEAVQALCTFQNVKRRMEVRAQVNGVTLYDDFAHHPTAIATTLAGLRGKIAQQRIIAVLEPRSNTMQLGVHNKTLLPSLNQADVALVYVEKGGAIELDGDEAPNVTVIKNIDDLVDVVCDLVKPNDHIVFMSNGGFSGIHQRVQERLEARI
jgi:UDP-N-acetylmuramate: L-alanyl-gamma-D-glutamyl-meso-diaminopimelate ligase